MLLVIRTNVADARPYVCNSMDDAIKQARFVAEYPGDEVSIYTLTKVGEVTCPHIVEFNQLGESMREEYEDESSNPQA